MCAVVSAGLGIAVGQSKVRKPSSHLHPLLFNFLTERKLRPLIRITDKNAQMVLFRKLLREGKVRIS
jgi:hypothetical protein